MDTERFQRTVILPPLQVRSIVTVYHMTLTPQHHSDERHDFLELIYVEKGPHWIRVDGQELQLESGQAMLHAPYVRHQTARPSNATLSIVSFDADWRDRVDFFDQVLTLTTRQRQLLNRVVSEGLEVLDRAWVQQGKCGMAPHPGVSTFELQQLRLQLELLLIDLLLSGSGPEEEKRPSNRANYKREQFDRLTDYLKSHLGDNLSLEQISRHCGMSPSVLKRLCQEQCGCAPMAYFLSMKIVRAKRLIRESSLTFTQIAEELGFHTVQYFSKRFRAATGMTPSDYARSANSAPER